MIAGHAPSALLYQLCRILRICLVAIFNGGDEKPGRAGEGGHHFVTVITNELDRWLKHEVGFSQPGEHVVDNRQRPHPLRLEREGGGACTGLSFASSGTAHPGRADEVVDEPVEPRGDPDPDPVGDRAVEPADVVVADADPPLTAPIATGAAAEARFFA
jgi:hypothetical protein